MVATPVMPVSGMFPVKQGQTLFYRKHPTAQLLRPDYVELHGRMLAMPEEEACRLHAAALAAHRLEAGARLEDD